MKIIKDILSKQSYELYIKDNPNELTYEEYIHRGEHEEEFKSTFNEYSEKARGEYYIGITQRINDGNLREASLLNSRLTLNN